MKNVLFICSRNQWRSRTAETLFKNDATFKVKSAGTSQTARIRVNEQMIHWADVIFVMEDMHKKRLIESFEESIAGKEVVVLGIPDVYKYMDEELVQELREVVPYYLEG